MSNRGDGQSRMLETCPRAGACAFTGKPAGHTRMPPGRREPVTEFPWRGFHAPLPSVAGAGPICPLRHQKQVFITPRSWSQEWLGEAGRLVPNRISQIESTPSLKKVGSLRCGAGRDRTCHPVSGERSGEHRYRLGAMGGRRQFRREAIETRSVETRSVGPVGVTQRRTAPWRPALKSLPNSKSLCGADRADRLADLGWTCGLCRRRRRRNES